MATPSLFGAIQVGDTEAVKRVLAIGANVDALDESGETALMQAAHLGHLEIVRVLIAADADVNYRSERGWTALAKAAYNAEMGTGFPPVIAALHEAGAPLDTPIFFGITPLMLAAGGGDADVVEWLINHGADVLATNDAGRTARLMASDKFYVEVINLLTDAERQLGVGEDGSCSSSKNIVKPHVINPLRIVPH